MTRSWLRPLLLVSALAALPLLDATPAQASVCIALTFDSLVHDSTSASFATPVERKSVWEDGRIITYTRVHIDQKIAGDLNPGDETWVASLGGVVGTIGQVVDGEPQLHVGIPYLLVLRPDRSATSGTRIVTGRAQGEIHLKTVTNAKGVSVLQTVNTPGAGELLAPKATASTTVVARLAMDIVADRPAADVAKDVVAAWSKQHAP
ncbi:MAG: hypothetical protein ABI551_04715 [Polyangiaceae bacterium]